MRIFLGGLIGLVVGYYAGALLACAVLWPHANLCGLLGVFVTGPLGMMSGIVLGWIAHRRARAQARPTGDA